MEVMPDCFKSMALTQPSWQRLQLDQWPENKLKYLAKTGNSLLPES